MTTDCVSVIGAGQMGYGLCVQFALAGQEVTLIGHRKSNVERARERIENAVTFLNNEELANAAPVSVIEGIDFTTDLSEGVSEADVVIETVSEDLPTKHAVFGACVDHAPADAVLATNTSSLRITDIAAGVPDDARRVAGCHWWNPPYLLAPVEVIRGEHTSEGTIARVLEFVERVGRDPVLVERDIPGFVWNRVQFAVLRECAHLVESGVASIADVDRAVRDGYARRTAVLGPFETADLAGLDLFRTIAAQLYPHLADDDSLGALFEARLAEGNSGVAAGAGFYEYDDVVGETERRDEGLAAIRRALGIGIDRTTDPEP